MTKFLTFGCNRTDRKGFLWGILIIAFTTSILTLFSLGFFFVPAAGGGGVVQILSPYPSELQEHQSYDNKT